MVVEAAAEEAETAAGAPLEEAIEVVFVVGEVGGEVEGEAADLHQSVSSSMYICRSLDCSNLSNDCCLLPGTRQHL